MNYLNIQLNKLPNTINTNYFNKKNKIPNKKIINNGLDNNYMTYYNQYSLNHEKCTKIIPHKQNYLNSYNLKSHGNIHQNNNIHDIDILKIKMGFDLINQKINNIENIIQSLNESNEPNYDYNILEDKKYRIIKMPLRDKIIYKKEIIKTNNMKRQINLNKQKNYTRIEPLINNEFVHHNYSVQNLKDKRVYNNYINDSNQKNNRINNNYNSFYSLQQEKSDMHNRTKYNSSNNLNILNFNEENINIEKDKLINSNNKSFNSISNRHIPNQKRNITKKIITNKNFFDNINKVPSLRNNIKKKVNRDHIQNNYFTDFIVNDNTNDGHLYNKINNPDSDIINKYIGEYYGSFDEYFLSDFQPKNQIKTSKGKDIFPSKSNNLNNKNINDNKLQQNNNNKKNNFNIYNIVKNDKIIQNNYYETKKKSNNKNLIIQNQNNFSFCIKNNKTSNEDDKYNTEQKKLNKEFTRNKFEISQLKKCPATDFFLPNKINNKMKDIISIDNSKEEKIEIEKNRIGKNIKVTETKNRKNSLRCKDDFYYDLYIEKILDVKKMNNSYEENNLLQKIKMRFFENSDKKIINKINDKININRKKGVRFFETDNKIIRMNQNDIATKFEVLNNFGKKIYFKKCNINNYLNKLKNKNLKLKSILINKKEEFVDNSEWDKLYDIINQIAKKNEKKQINNEFDNKNKNKKGKFNIKNIESFKKKGKKILLKANKSKK